MSMGYIVGYMQDGLEPAVHVGADDDRMLHDRMLHDGVRIVSVLHLCFSALIQGRAVEMEVPRTLPAGTDITG